MLKFIESMGLIGFICLVVLAGADPIVGGWKPDLSVIASPAVLNRTSVPATVEALGWEAK